MDWKEYFDNSILNRGFEYYQDGYVKNLKREGKIIEANVSGSQNYQVKVDLDHLEEMSCDCPYYHDGNKCKHLAAVMYAIEDEKDIVVEEPQESFEEDINTDDIEEDIEGFLEGVDELTVKLFLKEAFLKDESLTTDFINFVTKSKNQVNLSFYKKRLDIIFDGYIDHNGIVEELHISDFSYEIIDFIENPIQTFIESSYYEQAFSLMTELFQRLSHLNMNGSDRQFTMVSHHCQGIWENILQNNQDELLKNEMFIWFIKQIDQYDNPLSEGLFTIISKYFREKEYLIQKLEFIDYKLKNFKQHEESSSLQQTIEKWNYFRHKVVNQLENYKEN